MPCGSRRKEPISSWSTSANPCPQLEYPLATEEDLAETAQLVRNLGRRCVSRVADVRDEEQLRSAVDDGVAELGGLDGAVANAGVLTVGDMGQEQLLISGARWST